MFSPRRPGSVMPCPLRKTVSGRSDAEVVRVRPLRQRNETGLAPQVVADAGVVDDVVAVHRAGRGLQDRGQVQVRDAERGQVRHLLGGRGEAEA